DINWGSKGFSISTRRSSGQLLSIFHGYPAGALGRPSPYLEMYLKYVNTAEGAQSLRAFLLGLGEFYEAGQYTIALKLAESNIAKARAALPQIWEVYRRVGPATV